MRFFIFFLNGFNSFVISAEVSPWNPGLRCAITRHSQVHEAAEGTVLPLYALMYSTCARWGRSESENAADWRLSSASKIVLLLFYDSQR